MKILLSGKIEVSMYKINVIFIGFIVSTSDLSQSVGLLCKEGSQCIMFIMQL